MRRWKLVAALAALTLGGAGCGREADEAEQAQSAEAAGGVDRSHAGAAMPGAEIFNPADEATTLNEAAGEPVLVNLWATWCAPCVKELPTLDALSRRPGAPRVIAVSQDRGERPSIDAFLRAHEIGDVESWRDPKMALAGALNAQVLPTTVYYDAAGREVWRYVGDLDWTGDEAARLLREGGAEG
jgi:thiol-disulfide isomerase/thioredoxin